jgi:GMP synthase (glutamine-hydrolysing)
MRILVIQHDDDGPAGVVGERIDATGGQRITVRPHRGEPLPESPSGFAGALLLGGAMSVSEEADYPHSPHLFRLVRAFHDAGKPLLGICLGAQIVARALGQRVYRHEVREFGFSDVNLTAEGRRDPLFADLGATLRPMEWHEDTFDLPAEAILLAANETCRNQAFRVGVSTYGVQFHPEVDRAIVAAWSASLEAREASGSSDPARLLDRQMREHLGAAEALGRSLGDRWMALVSASASV